MYRKNIYLAAHEDLHFTPRDALENIEKVELKNQEIVISRQGTTVSYEEGDIIIAKTVVNNSNTWSEPVPNQRENKDTETVEVIIRDGPQFKHLNEMRHYDGQY